MEAALPLRFILEDFLGRFPLGELFAPSPKERVEPCDDGRQLLSDLASSGEGLDLLTGSLHGPHRRPAVGVIGEGPPFLPGAAGIGAPRWEPGESKALFALPESDNFVFSGGRGRRGHPRRQSPASELPQLGSETSTTPRSRPHSGRGLRCHALARPRRRGGG